MARLARVFQECNPDVKQYQPILHFVFIVIALLQLL